MENVPFFKYEESALLAKEEPKDEVTNESENGRKTFLQFQPIL